ncbi:MAG: YibE/F family protein [Candidatus Poribacteria bacterium]|nr:YibE/F family protein [Candidatus Poribacteria bacterium]
MRERNIKIITILLILLSVAALHIKLYRFAEVTHDGALQVLVCLGRVVDIDTNDEADQVLSFRILSGQFRGETVQVNNVWTGRAFGDRVLSKGNVLFLDIPLRDPSNPRIDTVSMREYFRTPFLLYLAGALGVLMILVAGMKGVRAILTLFVTALTVLYLLVPLTISGYNPIAVALLIAAFLTFATFLLITGFSFKVISGVIGTLGGLAAVGILSVISQHAMALTGLAQEFGFLELGIALWRTPASHHWNFTGILSAGIILGAVGAMMDVSMSISSSVHEVKQVNPNITVRQAIRAGLNVGRDIMGTMADTLIFAYLGAHMMTMLLPRIDFPEVGVLYPFLRLVNDEATAVAIIQAVVGTIGLVLTVPIAASVAGFLTQYAKVDISEIHEDLPSEEELEELFRADPPRSKARISVPIAMAIVLIGTIFVYYRTHDLSATVLEQRDAEGNPVNRSEYAKGKVLRLLESSGNFLFHIDGSAANDLDNHIVPTALREAFSSQNIPFSDEITVSVKPWKDSRWLLSDTRYEQTYSIRAMKDPVGGVSSESRLNVYESKSEHHILEVEMLSGMYKGRRLVLRNIVNHNMPLLSIPAEPGDVILCRVAGDPEQVSLVNIVQDYGRDRFLIWMVGGMLLLIILVGRLEGIRTACAMLMSAGVIYFFMLPLISQGANAVFIVTLTSGVVAFVSLVFVIGPSRKTFSAVLGTMGGILVAGLIVLFAQQHLHFSGLENAISADIIEATRTPPFDFVQILLAGMLMGVLGVAVDGAIEVASSMEEIRRANPNMPTWRLIASGLNVGTDILGTMVNTLVFAYLGVELLLVVTVTAPNLDFFKSPPAQLLSIGVVSAEIVRLLAGTLGLVLAIPITAIICAFWNPKRKA